MHAGTMEFEYLPLQLVKLKQKLLSRNFKKEYVTSMKKYSSYNALYGIAEINSL